MPILPPPERKSAPWAASKAAPGADVGKTAMEESEGAEEVAMEAAFAPVPLLAYVFFGICPRSLLRPAAHPSGRL